MSDAVEKLAEITEYAYDNVMDIDVTQDMICDSIAQSILAAIQANPLDYVKPKPLVWRRDDECHWVADAFGFDFYPIIYDDRSTVGCYSAFIQGEWVPHPTLEAAQQAAYDDLCKRVKELF